MLSAAQQPVGRLREPGTHRVRHARNECSSAARWRPPSRSTSASPRRSRSRSSRPTRSRRPRTRPRRSCSSSRSCRRASRSGLSKLGPDLDRGRGPARDRRDVVPPDDLRLSERRRLVHRQPREPRREPVARRGRVAARRLHPHGRGVDLGRRRRDHLDPAVRGRSTKHRVALCLAIIVVHHAREPARHQGVGPPVRVPDVPLHRRCSPRWSSSG